MSIYVLAHMPSALSQLPENAACYNISQPRMSLFSFNSQGNNHLIIKESRQSLTTFYSGMLSGWPSVSICLSRGTKIRDNNFALCVEQWSFFKSKRQDHTLRTLLHILFLTFPRISILRLEYSWTIRTIKLSTSEPVESLYARCKLCQGGFLFWRLVELLNALHRDQLGLRASRTEGCRPINNQPRSTWSLGPLSHLVTWSTRSLGHLV